MFIFIFSEFVGTWRLLIETTNGVDLFLSPCEINSTVVVSPTVINIFVHVLMSSHMMFRFKNNSVRSAAASASFMCTRFFK